MKNQYNPQLPKARTEKLIIKEIDGEVLVYDLTTDKAHCLNQTAALVWKNCDGEKSIGELNQAVSEALGLPLDDRIVWLALGELQKLNLLAQEAPTPKHIEGVNRRQLVRTLGVAALLLPAIVSITSQTAQAQASCTTPTGRPNGCPCTGNGNCASGNCSPPPKTCV